MQWDEFNSALVLRFQKSPKLQFWLRDDDAIEPTPALERLLGLSQTYKIPLALAVIPKLVKKELANLIQGEDLVTIVQHGFAHINHGRGQGLTGELQDHRPLEVTIAELAQGRERLEELFGKKFYPLLVPPWNSISEKVANSLSDVEFKALSTFGPDPRVKNLSIPEMNSDLDLIKWKPEPHFRGQEKCLTDLISRFKMGSTPIGILTHHLDMDSASFEFLEQLAQATQAIMTKNPWTSIVNLLGGIET